MSQPIPAVEESNEVLLQQNVDFQNTIRRLQTEIQQHVSQNGILRRQINSLRNQNNSLQGQLNTLRVSSNSLRDQMLNSPREMNNMKWVRCTGGRIGDNGASFSSNWKSFNWNSCNSGTVISSGIWYFRLKVKYPFCNCAVGVIKPGLLKASFCDGKTGWGFEVNKSLNLTEGFVFKIFVDIVHRKLDVWIDGTKRMTITGIAKEVIPCVAIRGLGSLSII